MSRFVGNPDQFRAHVAGLPAWDQQLDDDPNWVRPTEEVTGRPPVEYDAHNAYSRKLLDSENPPPLRPVPVDQIRQTQHQINLQAVRHYVDHPSGQLFDADGWLGTEHPVIIEHPVHGHVIADGNSRFTAALIRGNREIQAHVLPKAQKPEHVAAVVEYQRRRDASSAQHGERLDRIKERFGTPFIGPKAHPEAQASFQTSARVMLDEHAEHDRWLQTQLRR